MECSFYFHLVLLSSLLLLLRFSSSSSSLDSAVVAQTQSLSLKKRRCHDDEMAALLQFKRTYLNVNYVVKEYYGLIGTFYRPYSKVESWEEGRDCCMWEGVTCDEQDDHHVTGLDLVESCLYGSINSSSSLFTLTHLRFLDLSDNDFNYSPIPSAFGNLSSLTHLDLSYSGFTAQILQLSNLTNLVSLHLSFVDMSSAGLPHDFLSNFSSLESLALQSCGLKGEFPAAIFNLPKLRGIDLSRNPDLKGHLPNFPLGSPLQSLELYETSFGGVLPPSIGNLTSLGYIEIDRCNFIGEFPTSFGDLIISGKLITQRDVLDARYIWAGNHFTLTTTSLSWIGKLTNLTQLYLGNINVKGEIPSWLRNLTRLTELKINGNQLTGSIPSWLLTLPQLLSIDLSHNQLTGRIPSEFNHQMTFLDFSSNNLEGTIPTNVYTLFNLGFFSLERNRLIGSVELNLFCHLKNLYFLSLSYNKFSLNVKNISNKNVTCFPILKSIRLASCNLSEYPTLLHNNRNILELDLSHNNLRGQIPSWIFDLGRDTYDGLFLYLSHNLLTGFERIRPWAKIGTLDLRNNMLQGSLPIPPPSSSSTFSSFLISNNGLSGEISHLICNFTSLKYLDLSYNGLSGKLPQCLSNLSDSLKILDVRENKLVGDIPSAWRNGCQLRMVSLRQNHLQGELSRSLANCSLLEFVDFSNNQISDTFPFWLGRITSLSVIILRSNSFHGVINDDYGFSNLRVIDLSNNNFGGKLPSKLIDASNPMRGLNASPALEYMEQDLQLHAMEEYDDFIPFDYSMTIYNKGSERSYSKIVDIFCGIDFSSNNFGGQIPDVYGELAGLQLLNLSRNHLSGHIPPSFSNMKNVESLDLSQNKLSGQIPMELTKLNFLASFDVSFNNLSGLIPQGKQFCTYDSKPYEGNPGLSLETWSEQCGNARSLPELQHPPSLTGEDGDDNDDDDSKIKWMIISIGFASGLAVGVILGNELIARKRYWFVKTFARIGIQ